MNELPKEEIFANIEKYKSRKNYFLNKIKDYYSSDGKHSALIADYHKELKHIEESLTNSFNELNRRRK